jgi:hypothetical protein
MSCPTSMSGPLSHFWWLIPIIFIVGLLKIPNVAVRAWEGDASPSPESPWQDGPNETGVADRAGD